MASKKIGVLGSGQVAQTLASGFLKHGYDVMIGSRDTGKLDEWKAKNPKGSVGSFESTAKFGDTLVLSVKGTGAELIVKSVAPSLAGKVVIDTCNPIAETAPVNGVLSFFTNLEDSLMERLQKKVPDAKFVKAFSSTGNPFMVNPSFPGGRPTMFICGNDEGAKKEVTKILDQFGWETEDCGKVESARVIEPLSILWCIPGFLRNEWQHAFKLLKM